MGTHYNLDVVTDGLILYLDAGNTKSYSGTGSTWYDLTRYKNNATINGTTQFTTTDGGGKFDYRGVSQITDWINLPTAPLQATSAGYCTMQFWMQPESSGTRYFNSMFANANNNWNIIQVTSNQLISYKGGSGLNFTDDEWMMLTIVRNNSDSANMYKNAITTGVSATINDPSEIDTGGWALNQEQDSLGGGFQATQNTYAAFSIVKVYDKVLSADEIAQNFYALRGRFGI